MNVIDNIFFFEVIIFVFFLIIIFEFFLYFKFTETISLIKNNLIKSFKIINSNNLDDTSKQNKLLKEISRLFKNQLKIIIFVIIVLFLFYLISFFLIDMRINLYKNFYSIIHIIFCLIIFLLYSFLRKLNAR